MLQLKLKRLMVTMQEAQTHVNDPVIALYTIDGEEVAALVKKGRKNAAIMTVFGDQIPVNPKTAKKIQSKVEEAILKSLAAGLVRYKQCYLTTDTKVKDGIVYYAMRPVAYVQDKRLMFYSGRASMRIHIGPLHTMEAFISSMLEAKLLEKTKGKKVREYAKN